MSKEQLAQEAQWVSVLKSGQLHQQLPELNVFLRDHTFISQTLKPSTVDSEVFEAAFPLVKDLVSSTKDVSNTYAQYRHLIRWVDYMQNFTKASDKLVVNYDLALPREVIEKKKKKDAGTDAGKAKGKDEKKDAGKKKDAKDNKPRGKPDEETLKKLREEAKAKKAAKKAAAAANPQDKKDDKEKPKPSIIDFRVGFIQKAIKHPDADSLYVSTIDVGDEEGPRTVCSGLVKHFSLEAMQERYVVVVCNLKPVNMRGIKSTAMVLCGSTDEKVEFVEPPKGSKAGEKVFFEGFGDEEPMKQLNPKKKLWEQIQPNFSTNENLEVIIKDDDDKEKPIRKLTNSRGDFFKVASIVNAQVR